MAKTSGAGYTIVELLIVLTVTAITAVSALIVVRGQQQKSEFSQSVNNFSTKLTDIANDVSTGYFPDNVLSQRCEATGSGINFVSGSIPQGSNSQCVFIGKAVVFDESEMRIISIASRRRLRNNGEIFSLSSLQNRDVSPIPGLDEAERMVYGLRVSSIRINSVVGGIWPAVVFLSGFGTEESSGSLTGSPVTDMYAVSNTSTNNCATSTIDEALRIIGCYIDPVSSGGDGITLCTNTGGSGKSARYSLGKNGRELTVTTEILEAGVVC